VTEQEGTEWHDAAFRGFPAPGLATVLGEVLLLTLRLGAAVSRVVVGFGGRPFDPSNGLAHALAHLNQQSEVWLTASAREPLAVWRRDHGLPSLELWRRVALTVGLEGRAGAQLPPMCEQLRIQLIGAAAALPAIAPDRYRKL